jgi:hypothetical protein
VLIEKRRGSEEDGERATGKAEKTGKRARGDVVAAFRSTQPAEHRIQGKNAGKETPYSFCFEMVAAHYQV